MFKRKISGFFTNSSGGKDQLPEEESSAWRKNISPVPYFLLNPKKAQKKDSLFSNREDFMESPQGKNLHSKQKHSSSPKDKIFRGEKVSSQISHNRNKGYSFTMTKLSMWTVAFSLFLLGILFFILGFLVALYLMGSKPTFVSKIEHTVSKDDRFLTPTKNTKQPPVAPTQQSTQSSSETGNLSMNFKPNAPSVQNSETSPIPSTVATPSPQPSPPPAASPSSALPASTMTPQPVISPSKLSPLLKNNPLNFKKTGSSSGGVAPYSIQFGSFSTKDDALKRVNALIPNGYKCVVIRSVNNLNKLSFSVISGSYQNREQAENAFQGLGTLEKAFFPTIIRNNPSAVIVYP